jgi:deoxyribonuclease-4
MKNRAKRGPFPLIGAHQSIAGGVHKAVERAASDGCDSLQLFTRSPRTWKDPPPLEERQIALFKEARSLAAR